MGACGGVAEYTVHGLFDGSAHNVFPPSCLVVGIGPRQAEKIGEEAFGDSVTAHGPKRDHLPGRGEADGSVGGEQTLGLHPTDHLADGRPADLEPIGDARLDDRDVVFCQLVNALAVLLEGRVVLSDCGHGCQATGAQGRGPE